MDDFLGLVYDAAVDIDRWPEVLSQLSDLVGGAGALLSIQNMMTGRGEIISSRMPDEAERLYADYYHARNVFSPRVPGLRPGAFALDHQLVPRETLVRTEFFNDFMRPYDLCSPVAVILLKEPHFTAAAVCGRTYAAGEFEREHLERLRLVSPHLQRATRICERLSQMRIVRDSTVETLNRIADPVFLLDENLRIVFANGAAESLLNERGGLANRKGILIAGSSQESASLRRLIVGAARRPRGEAAGGTMALSRTPPRRPLGVLVAPLESQDRRQAFRPGLAIMFVSDPDRAQLPPREHLRNLYGLTPMEAAVALGIARGDALPTVAEELGVSLTTARTHLQHIFDKTATRRQGELVRLLAHSWPKLRS
jgi:DNA-binding CsgD family transcriptional regulator/PAS domain-containing protein